MLFFTRDAFCRRSIDERRVGEGDPPLLAHLIIFKVANFDPTLSLPALNDLLLRSPHIFFYPSLPSLPDLRSIHFTLIIKIYLIIIYLINSA